MKKREEVILTHILQSLTVAVLAGLIVAVLQRHFSVALSSCADRVAAVGQYGIASIIVFGLACLGIACPGRFTSVVRSLRRFPVHFGLLVKVAVGSTVYLLLGLKWPHLSGLRTLDDYVYSFGLLLGFCLSGVLLGYIVACLVKETGRESGIVPSQGPKKQGLDAWLVDDQPIRREADSLFSAHSAVAGRILKKLLHGGSDQSEVLPSLALVGPYGSGKTSICNLVEDIYHQDKRRENWPELIFCRFEAWQFLSAEAAVRTLIDVARKAILELADLPELWRIPEKYVEAIKASGSRWGSFCALLFGGSHNPQEITLIIGEALLRLDLRLVIFVDDFDRIEGDTFATQQAVAKALNQLQNLPNTQYLISFGPTPSIEKRATVNRPSWDLLKLTRFQELVPKINAEMVVSLTRELRERALEENTYYFPWAEINEGETEPLTYDPVLARFQSYLGFSGRLVELASTPRLLKSTLRESDKAWQGGLKGEIDWYDLILVSALKAAEPGVFEWIARDPEVFIQEPRPLVSGNDSQRNEQYAKDVEKRLSECIQSKDPRRYQIVKESLYQLFPAFELKTKPGLRGLTVREVPQWSQKIGCVPNHGSSYMERFFAGGVCEVDIPDQPTLQYFRKVMHEGVDATEFESLYLSSYEKLTGPLNKIVQFAGLMSKEVAYHISDAMLAWIARPENAAYLWPDSGEYICFMADITSIIRFSGMRQRARRMPPSEDQPRRDWFAEKIDQYAGEAPFVAIELLRYASEDSLITGDHEKQLGQALCREFVDGDRPFLPALRMSRYSLALLVDRLRRHTEYENLRTKLTDKLIAEAERDGSNQLKERIIISLVNIRYPAGSREIPLESYEFSVDPTANERNYDMSLLVPALKLWHAVQFSDKVAEKALSHLARPYDLEAETRNTLPG